MPPSSETACIFALPLRTTVITELETPSKCGETLRRNGAIAQPVYNLSCKQQLINHVKILTYVYENKRISPIDFSPIVAQSFIDALHRAHDAAYQIAPNQSIGQCGDA